MDNTVSLFKSKTSKQAVYGRGKKLSKPKKQKKKEIRFYQKRIKKKNDDIVCRDIRTIFKAEEEKEEIKRLEKLERKKQEHIERLIKDRIIRDIRSRFEQQEEDYSNPKSVSNFWNNNYIEYESNGDRNLSLDKYLSKIKPYLRNIIIDLQSSGTWKWCYWSG